MNKYVIGILSFVAGAVSGFCVGYLFRKTKFDLELREQCTEVEKYYRSLVSARHPETKEAIENVEPMYAAPTHSQEVVRDSTKVKYEKPESPDYDKFYNVDEAEMEHPFEAAGEEDEHNDSTGEYLTREALKNKFKQPELIESCDFGQEPGFSTCTLKYYKENDTLVVWEEDANVQDIIYFDEVEDWIGDALIKFGFCDNDEKRIFVRNWNRSTDFEVIKVFAAFEG